MMKISYKLEKDKTKTEKFEKKIGNVYHKDYSLKTECFG